MFESALEQKLKAIFDFDKVRYDQVSESREQECLFVEVDLAQPTIKDTKQFCKVQGQLVAFANHDKLPFGYFQKKIKQADPDLTRDIFFYDIEANTKVINNIVQRSMSFVYFFSAQYDPNQGSITSIELSEAQ